MPPRARNRTAELYSTSTVASLAGRDSSLVVNMPTLKWLVSFLLGLVSNSELNPEWDSIFDRLITSIITVTDLCRELFVGIADIAH